jgi:pSer/pThr/pTyr-binding forkhead associated (FHA) protein
MATEPKGTLNPIGGGDSMPLLREHMTLGRRESCDIRLNFPNISSIHCEFTFQDGYWFIKDLNSTNGVKVNGSRIFRKVLLPGDELTIGKKKYVIHYTLAAGRRALEEIMEDDVMSQSLLERAGLVRSRRDEDEDDRPRVGQRKPPPPASSPGEPEIDWKSE